MLQNFFICNLHIFVLMFVGTAEKASQWPTLQIITKIHKLRTKKFHNIGHRILCYKTLSIRNLLIFLISQSGCQTTLGKLVSNSHSSFLRKLINYRWIEFCKIGSWAQCYKTFLSVIFEISQSGCHWQCFHVCSSKHSSLV